MVLSCLPGASQAVQLILSLPPGASLVPPRLSKWCVPSSLVPPRLSNWSFPASLVPRKLSNESFPASLVLLRLSTWSFPASLVPSCQRQSCAPCTTGSQPWSPPQDLPRTEPIAIEIVLKVIQNPAPFQNRDSIGNRATSLPGASLVPPRRCKWFPSASLVPRRLSN